MTQGRLFAAPEPSPDRDMRSTGSVHFSSRTDQWATPDDCFADLDREFGFTLDACADDSNHKCAVYFTREVDGLAQTWGGVVWMNPPYGREIWKWIRKAYDASLHGAIVVCLVPARTDTQWWHEWVTRAAEVRFLRGRLKFGGAKTSAPFPSCVVVFRPERIAE